MAPSRSPLALSEKGEVEAGLVVVGIGGDPGLERGGVAERGGLRGEVDLGADGGDRGVVGGRLRAPGERLAGRVELAGGKVAAGEADDRRESTAGRA